MCVHGVSLVCPMFRGGEKRALDPQALDLQTVVNHHVGAGKRTWDLSKSNKFS